MTTAHVEGFGLWRSTSVISPTEWIATPVTPEDYDAAAPPIRGSWAADDALLPAKEAARSRDAVRVVVRVLKELRDERYDFRTADSIAKTAGLASEQVEAVLRALGRAVRQPVGARGDELEYFRLVDRGLTRGERRRRLKFMLTRG